MVGLYFVNSPNFAWRTLVSLTLGPGGRQAQCLASATELALPTKHGENASFAHNYCVNRPILKILDAQAS